MKILNQILCALKISALCIKDFVYDNIFVISVVSLPFVIANIMFYIRIYL